MNDRVSRYWQVFRLRHQQSVLTAAALHSLNTHTKTKKGEVHEGSAEVGVLYFSLGFLNLTKNMPGDDAAGGVMVAGELIRAGFKARPGLRG